MIVYLVKNRVNDKGYVGYTKRGLEKRWHEHVSNARRGKKEMPLYTAIRKYGASSFDLSVLQECSSVQEMKDVEIRLIKELGTFVGDGNGYNATHGGDGVTGWSPSSDHRQKIREANTGVKNGNYGGLSDEHKRNVSIGRKGKGLGNKSALGYHHTEKAKAKIGVAASLHKRKSVAKCSKDGIVLAVYPSLIDAAKDVHGQANKISEVLCGHRRTHKGYVWAYALERGLTTDGVEV